MEKLGFVFWGEKMEKLIKERNLRAQAYNRATVDSGINVSKHVDFKKVTKV